MKQLKSIGVASIFKMSAILGAVAGFLAGTVLMISDISHDMVTEGILTFVLAPFLYGLLGALVNALMAWVYNAVAARMGGIEIEID